MHARGIELHNAIGVRQSAEPDGLILGIELLDVDAGDRRIDLTSTDRPERLADRVRDVLDAEINPVIAAHGGRVTLVEVDQGWVRIQLEGGCQGCSLAEVTVRQGIEPLLRARVPEVVGLADVTDHAAGTTPFFSAEKR